MEAMYCGFLNTAINCTFSAGFFIREMHSGFLSTAIIWAFSVGEEMKPI